MGDESALHITANRLHVNPQERFEFFGREYLRQSLGVRRSGALWPIANLGVGIGVFSASDAEAQ